MASPFVSVILPFFDAQPYLKTSIQSICAQKYDNFEVILVDDGSRDESRAIASTFLSRKVSLLCQSNCGVGGAFNAGMKVAQGDFIFLHGADDIASDDRLRRCVDLFRSEEVDIVTCRPEIIDESDTPIGRAAFPVFDRDCDASEPFAMLASLFYLENFICAPAAAVSRRTLEIVGSVHAGLMQLQDFDYWLRAAALGLRFHIDDVPWLSYRRHGGNLSHRANLPRLMRELQLVYRRVAPLLTGGAALRILAEAATVPIDLDRLHDAPDAVLTPLVFMAHAKSSIRQIGYEMLMDLLGSKEKALLFGTYTDLSPRQCFEMLKADP